MAYTPISSTTKKGGYTKIGTTPTTSKQEPKVVPDIPLLIPGVSQSTQQRPAINGFVDTGSAIEGAKKVGGFAKEIAQATARPIAATGVTALSLDTQKTINPTTNRFSRAVFGDKPFSLESESVSLGQTFGVPEEKSKVFLPPVVAGLSVLDVMTGPGKKGAISKSIKAAETAEDATKVARSLGLSDEVIFGLKLDDRIVRAKTDADVEAILKDVAKSQAPLPPKPKQTTPQTISEKPKMSTAKVEQLSIAPQNKKINAETLAKSEDPIAEVAVARGLNDVEVQETLNSLRQWISTGARGQVNSQTLNQIERLNIKPDKPVTLYRIGDVNENQFQSWSKIKPTRGEKFTGKTFAPEEILVDTTAPELKILYRDDPESLNVVNNFNRVEGEIIAKPKSMVNVKPELPSLPKLPPEIRQQIETRQANETIARAVFDRYKNVANKPPVTDSKIVALAKRANTPGETKKMFGELLTPIASRLRRINPGLETTLRKFEFQVNQNTEKSMRAIKPLLDGSAKMSPIDRKLFSLSRLNGDKEVYEAIAKKYNLSKELKAAEDAIEDIRLRANSVGMDIAKRENYNPRIIKNPKAYLNYWRNQEDWGDINRLIEAEAEKRGIKYGDLMKDAEKVASIINNYVRGYGNKTVLASPSFAKQRTIAVLDEELADFYEDADTALATYMIRMNDEIEARRFFGKRNASSNNIMGGNVAVEKELTDSLGRADIEDSIGAYVMDLVATGKIKPQQQEEVADILRARFHRGKMAGALDVYRNAEYISTMGNPISAITQIGDFTWSVYDNGFWPTVKSAVGKKKITREDLGLDASIMNEYTNGTLSGKAVEKTFKLVGLDKMARLGQETMVNAQFGRYQKMARQNDDVLKRELDRLFDADEAQLAMREFANGDVTERTKFVVFNRLLDFQPLTKSEMPQVYLEHPNGRIFYMLKSFTLKQYDVFRREAFDQIATGDPAKVKQGVKNLVALAGLFMMANATADEIKDLVLGRETPPSDRLIDNLWRLVGASKYDVYSAREDGIGTTVLRKILFPASIWDRLSKDFETVRTDKEYERGPMAGEDYKFESTQTIPVGGKLYYWWFGRGAQKEEYKESQATSTNTELPKLPPRPPQAPVPPQPPKPPRP